MSAKFKNGIYIDGGNADTASGQVYKINGTTVLSSTQVLGKGFSTTAGDITTIDATQTLTNKTLTSPTINGGTHTALTNFALRDTSAAFDVTITATSSTPLNGGKTLTIDIVNAAKTIKLGGNITTAADFITSGANSLTLTTTGTTNATLPLGTVTLVARDSTDTLTNKTLTSAKLTSTAGSGPNPVTITSTQTTSGQTITFPEAASGGNVALYSGSTLTTAITSSSITKTGLTSAGYVKTDGSGNLTSTTATTLETPWATIAERSGTVSVVNPGGFPVLLGMGLTNSSVSGTTVAGQIFYIDPTDYTLTGYTANWRLVVNGLTNANTTIDTTKTPQVTVKTFNNTSTSTVGQTGPSYTGTAYWPCTLPATSPNTTFQVSASTTSFSPSTAKHLVMVLDLPTGAIVTSNLGLNISARLQVKYVQN